jgi:hypothetical protein
MLKSLAVIGRLPGGGPGVKKRVKKRMKFGKVRKSFPRQRPLVLVPELVKFRDDGEISAAECATWSYMIEASRLRKELHPRLNGPLVHLIRRMHSGWRLFTATGEARKKLAVGEPRRTWHQTGRGLVIFIDANGKIQFTLLTPSVSAVAATKGAGTANRDKQIRYMVACRTCGWSAENVRRIERSKEKHRARCEGAEIDVAPYIPISIHVDSGERVTMVPGRRVVKLRRLVSSKSGRLPKGMHVDRSLHQRGDLSAPDVYPDDN